MAHQVEPMDVDSMNSDFDNKENSYHHSNVPPCTEKGYEELDVSELNMKLRYSVTPAASPMSKSYTAFVDSRNLDDDSPNCTIENVNLTRSLNSTMTKNDSVIKSLKSLPLQAIATEQFADNRSSVLRQLDSTISRDDNDKTVTLSTPNENDDYLSYPSTSSSAIHTPDATTPTNIKIDESSPIIRGLKSVFNMFRTSQSPVPPTENDNTLKHEVLSAENQTTFADQRPQTLASTPISTHRSLDGSTSKRSSPLKESIVFNDDLEKELQWEEDTILFKDEKIPLHKLFLQTNVKPTRKVVSATPQKEQKHPAQDMNTTLEYMDVSYTNSMIMDTTLTETKNIANSGESDGEFVDCETTFTKIEHENETKDEIQTVSLESVAKLGGKNQAGRVSNVNETEENVMKENTKTIEISDNIVAENVMCNLYSEFKENEQVTSANSTIIFENITQETISENVPSFDITEEIVCESISNEVKIQDKLHTNADVTLNSTNKMIINEDIADQKKNSAVKNDTVHEDHSADTVPSVNVDIVEEVVIASSELVSIEGAVSIIPDTEITLETPLDGHKKNEHEESNVSYLEETELVRKDKKHDETFSATTNINQAKKSFKANREDTLQTEKNNSNIAILDESKLIMHKNNEDIHFEMHNLICESNIASAAIKNITVECVEVLQQNTSEPNILQEDNDNLYLKTDKLTENVVKTDTENAICEMVHVNTEIHLTNDVTIMPEEILTIITCDNVSLPSTMSAAPADEPANIPLPDDDDIGKNIEPVNNMNKNIEDIYNLVCESNIASTSIKNIPVECVKELQQNTSKLNILQEANDNLYPKTDKLTENIIKTNTENAIREMVYVNNEIHLTNDVTIMPEEILTIITCDNVSLPSTMSAAPADEPVNIPLPDDDDIGKNIEPVNNMHKNIEDISNLVCESNIASASIKNIPVECVKELQQNTSELNLIQEANDNLYPKTDKLTENIVKTNTENAIREMIYVNNEIHLTNDVTIMPEEILTIITCDNVSLPSTMNAEPADEPANVQLPDDDIGKNLEPVNKMSKVSSVEIPPDVLDTTTSDSKQDGTELTSKILNETAHLNVLEKTIGELELPPTEKNDIFNETNDIVNNLNEIIGESPNSTQSDCILDQSQSVEVVGCTDETHMLPDLVNQTINVTNTATASECEMTDRDQSIIPTETIKEMHCKPKKSETIFNVSKAKPLKTGLDISVIENSTEYGNNPTNPNKEHTKATVVKTEIIDAVPTQEDTNAIEIENAFKKDSQIVDVPDAKIMKIDRVPILNEELVVSDNNNPYVSVIAETETKQKEEHTEKVNIEITSTAAPSSPPIQSKGYNFNFDEMDDPFATKTKSIQSPPHSNKMIEKDNDDKNDSMTRKVVSSRRRSQPPQRKRLTINSKKFNTTFDALNTQNSIDHNCEGNSKIVTVDFIKSGNGPMEIKKIDAEENIGEVANSFHLSDKTDEGKNTVYPENKFSTLLDQNVTLAAENITIATSTEKTPSIESLGISASEIKTSSSEQSTYYSAAASSSDSFQSRNVFNLPEIDDSNFNPFATKSKMRRSPLLEFKDENTFATKSSKNSPNSSMAVLPSKEKLQISPQSCKKDAVDKMDTELMEKDTSYSIGNTTFPSKTSNDIQNTSCEVNTEDEDTEEGPFFELEDTIDRKKNEIADMMQFNETPKVCNENVDDGELFIDAEAFDFLLNQNKSDVVADSGKESLFLKFDPLFAKRMSSDGILAALSKVQKRESTPTKPIQPSLKNEKSPIARSSTFDATYDGEMNVTQESNEDLNITVAKPMMVVTPAVNPAVTSRNKSTTPSRSNRHSITFTSPAMAVIDRLLSLSGNSSFVGQDTTITQLSREPNEADVALTQLRELLAEKEISVYQLRTESNELKDRLSTMESHVKILETSSQERLQKINELNDRLAEKAKINKRMAAVVEEYERTIASLIAETEQDKKRHAEERIRLINERDEQTAHLASMEVSFSDLHSKYEKSKQVILSCKANEETCRKSIKEFEENLVKMQTNYEYLKQHATSQLNYANRELQKLNKAHESEVLKLNAMIKRKEMHITSLEETLAQKTKANEELTAICDELINKVG